METATYVFESNTWNNVVEEGQRVGRGLHVAGVAAVTRHGLASNARRKHRRNEPGKTEEILRRSDTVTNTATAATASTPPVVPVGGGARRRCVQMIGTARHCRYGL